MTDDRDELVRLLERVEDDYRNDRRFFGTHTAPSYAVLKEVDFAGRSRALYVTFTCVTDHIHNVVGRSKQTAGKDGLWWVCARLLQAEPWLFEPSDLVGDDRRSDLEARFRRVDLMDSRDPDWWYRTATILHDEFDSDARNLLRQYDYDAVRLEAAITGRYDFPGLWGRKSCPRWLRLMNDEIHELANLDAIRIPVGDHVVHVVGELRGEPFDPDDREVKAAARGLWEEVCERNGFTPVQLEVPLWLLHRHWGSGGREYVAAMRRELRA